MTVTKKALVDLKAYDLQIGGVRAAKNQFEQTRQRISQDASLSSSGKADALKAAQTARDDDVDAILDFLRRQLNEDTKSLERLRREPDMAAEDWAELQYHATTLYQQLADAQPDVAIAVYRDIVAGGRPLAIREATRLVGGRLDGADLATRQTFQELRTSSLTDADKAREAAGQMLEPLRELGTYLEGATSETLADNALPLAIAFSAFEAGVNGAHEGEESL